VLDHLVVGVVLANDERVRLARRPAQLQPAINGTK
jgi:hypothetical protein